MQDPLEALELRRISEDLLGELCPVDLLVLSEHLGAEGLHDRAVADRSPHLLVAHERVRVEHLRAELAQHPGDHRLARADLPRQSDDVCAHSLFSLSLLHSSYSSRSDFSSNAYSSLTRRVSM